MGRLGTGIVMNINDANYGETFEICAVIGQMWTDTDRQPHMGENRRR